MSRNSVYTLKKKILFDCSSVLEIFSNFLKISFPLFSRRMLSLISSSSLEAPSQSPLQSPFSLTITVIRFSSRSSPNLFYLTHSLNDSTYPHGFCYHLWADDVHVCTDNPDFSPKSQINVSNINIWGYCHLDVLETSPSQHVYN